MSYQSELVAMPNGLNLDEVRLKFLEGFALARLRKSILYTGAATLAGDVDLALADCTSAAFSLTLPAAPVDGDNYEFMKLDPTANVLTIARNGKTINGATADKTIATQFGTLRLTWSAAANTWASR